MPTPVKYGNAAIRDAYRDVGTEAEHLLLGRLPADLREAYEEILEAGADKSEDEAYLRRLVKAADKLSALIKCIEEEGSGNQEFRSARVTIERALAKMAAELPEVADFQRDFLPAYGKTLDELTEEPS